MAGVERTKRVAIGTVGYYAFLRGYPLGPELMERLQSVPWALDVTLSEMNWGPIAIVQDFQAKNIVYDRAVLVASVDRGEREGTVTCRRWLGGALDALEMQNRMHEAVTGTISLDNLLIIGEYFKIWPAEVITVELQLNENSFGEFVLGEMEQPPDRPEVVGKNPITQEVKAIVDQLVRLTERAASHGAQGLPGLVPLTADQLTPVGAVLHNRFVHDPRFAPKSS